jgi:hypothetical protein
MSVTQQIYIGDKIFNALATALDPRVVRQWHKCSWFYCRSHMDGLYRLGGMQVGMQATSPVVDWQTSAMANKLVHVLSACKRDLKMSMISGQVRTYRSRDQNWTHKHNCWTRYKFLKLNNFQWACQNQIINQFTRPVDGHVWDARRNRALEFQRPPDFYCPLHMYTYFPVRSMFQRIFLVF